ncbi:MAG: hypothetical protein HRT89_06500 [Lentisphaeria bacterium]|nr:hypothetical protein [Lentisphaeria bacterium]NQZ67703.1 hypothetical protein [Lentisphaeria bacterium]
MDIELKDDGDKPCPGCAKRLPADAVLCTDCGYHLQAASKLNLQKPPDKVKDGPQIQKFTKRSWSSLGIGLVLALILSVFQFPKFVMSYFIILVHETGHALASWVFGSPALPQFNFQYGGGITRHLLKQEPLYYMATYIFLAWLIYLNRKNIIGLLVFIPVFIVYAIINHSGQHHLLVTFMGHGFELVIAIIFIYRAIGGTSMEYRFDQPIYAMCGFFILIYDAIFTFKLLYDPGVEHMYRNRPDGHVNDFEKLYDFFSFDTMNPILYFFFTLISLSPIISILAYRYKKWWFAG